MKKSFILLILVFCLYGCAISEYYGIRPHYTASAGYYFPDNKEELKNLINKYIHLADVDIQLKQTNNIIGIIAPHAGYNYSGAIAAASYKHIVGEEKKTVIIISNSHNYPLNGISIYPLGSFETPLGIVKIDEELANKILKNLSFVKFYPHAFEKEHPIDNQIPFLQMTLTNFKILPLVIGKINQDDFENLTKFLTDIFFHNPDKYLILASADMSHYHNYQRAKIMDNDTIKKIKHLDTEGLAECLLRKNCELCGPDAVLTLMEVTKRLKGSAKFLKYLNSGDTVGEKDRVVGYGAFIFYLPHDKSPLTSEEKRTLLKIARKTLERYIVNKEIPDLLPDDNRLLKKGAVFITLKKNGLLRGCMGTLESKSPLYLSVTNMTVQAATRDIRYRPITEDELKDTVIEISYIGELKEIQDIADIEIGKHGLYLCKGLNCAIFLPQVATENRWDREEFLRRLAVKAGLPPSSYKDSDTKIYTFTAQVFSEE